MGFKVGFFNNNNNNNKNNNSNDTLTNIFWKFTKIYEIYRNLQKSK